MSAYGTLEDILKPLDDEIDEDYVPSGESRFGIGTFWSRYDKLADQKDKEMSRNLNGNLDVLLIFAGLFSAVNTAFISLAIPLLSPTPQIRPIAFLERFILQGGNRTLASLD